ncbi:Alkane hydroxylase MAH1 [Linum grandiflorum]
MASIAILLLLIPFLTATLVYIISGGNYKFYKLIYDALRSPLKLHDTITDRLKSCGRTLQTTYLSFTCDPKNFDHVFNKRHTNFPKGPEFKDKLDALGEGIFRADGESGLSQRRIFHSIFNSAPYEQLLATSLLQKLESGLFPLLESSSSTDCAVGGRSVELDMQDVYKRFMFDIICTVVVGYDPNYLTVELLPDVLYAKAYEDMEEAAFYRYAMPDFWWKFQRWVGIGEERKYQKAWDRFDEFLYKRIDIKRSLLDEREKKNHNQFDLLTFFMLEGREENESGGESSRIGKSDKLMRDMAFNMIAAGRDSVSINLSWLLWLIVSHPKVEAKILEEIEANIQGRNSKNWRLFSEEEMNKMVYLHAAVCEALRLYPPVAFEHRTTVEAETLPSGHFVGKNTAVLFSLYSMGRMEEVWGEDCMEFKPERWISEEGDKILHVPSYKFSAFLSGPKTCLGKKIAFLYAKQVTSALLYNYKVELVEGHSVVPAVSIILPMKHGLKVRVSRRR